MLTLSKSKIIAFRQCPKRLWLEVHHPELREDSAAAEARFQVGYEVGAIARKIYDPNSAGALIEGNAEGFQEAFRRSAELLGSSDQPVFEAGFKSGGAMAFADVMMPAKTGGWRMVEVKSSTGVRDYHRDDVAVQTFIAKGMGVKITSVAVAHVDSSWVYPGGGDYRGLLIESDLTEEVFGRADEVAEWIRGAHEVAALREEPKVETGDQCSTPFECGFCNYCNRGKTPPEFPVDWLPRLSVRQRRELTALNVDDLRYVPDALMSDKQRRVRRHTLENTTFLDAAAAAGALEDTGFPAYFLDFETTNMPVPIWTGTRPYEQIPFQFSLHKLGKDFRLEQLEFLDLTGEYPAHRFGKAVVEACGKSGPIFVYNAKFEKRILREVGRRYPEFSPSIQAIVDRIVDLHPVAERCFYHPSQCGSWSIKSVLPAAVPELSYESLPGVKDGGMAMEAFREAIHPETSEDRKEEIRRELLAYCRLDTLAMVGLWKLFRNSTQPELSTH